MICWPGMWPNAVRCHNCTFPLSYISGSCRWTTPCLDLEMSPTSRMSVRGLPLNTLAPLQTACLQVSDSRLIAHQGSS